jgi:predicted  nucleic acid-binding Zn-ribbon protein
VNEGEIAYSLILQLQYEKLVLEGRLTEADGRLGALEETVKTANEKLAEAEARLREAEARLAEAAGPAGSNGAGRDPSSLGTAG